MLVLKEYGITKLGLWNEEFIDTYEEDVNYNEEDAKLFGELRPDFYLDLDQGGNENECAGRIFSVELNGDTLKLVGSDDWDSKTFSMSAKNVDYEEDRIKVNEVMKAIIMSIRFNQENNVPVEKWGVAHFPDVDPYTYEYLNR